MDLEGAYQEGTHLISNFEFEGKRGVSNLKETNDTHLRSRENHATKLKRFAKSLDKAFEWAGWVDHFAEKVPETPKDQLKACESMANTTINLGLLPSLHPLTKHLLENFYEKSIEPKKMKKMEQKKDAEYEMYC